MTKYLYATILMCLFVGFAACKKDKNPMRTAVIIQTGDISYEGCGYIIKMDDDGEMLKPVSLPGAYQHNNMRVEVSFNHTGIVDTCDYGTVLYDLVNIEEIMMIR